MIIQDLEKKRLIHPPRWLSTNVHYLTIMGSQAYGVASVPIAGKVPDTDVYGVCIPPKDIVFPHLRGEIFGFGWQEPERFNQWQEHHILDQDAHGGKGQEWDFQIYSIVRYFQLCMQNNPNMIDSLFTPRNCVIHITRVGEIIRDNRHKFLSRHAWVKFRGYAQSQLAKLKSRKPEGERAKIVAQYGYDVKFAYHTVRLLLEAEQILTEGDINLQRDKETLAAIRGGYWTVEDIVKFVSEKDLYLEGLFSKSNLPPKANEKEIRMLLLHCLEEHYGSLDACVVDPSWSTHTLREIDAILERVRGQLYDSDSGTENP